MGPDLMQQRIPPALYTPALVIGKMPVEFVEFEMRSHPDHFLQFVRRNKMSGAVDMKCPPRICRAVLHRQAGQGIPALQPDLLQRRLGIQACFFTPARNPYAVLFQLQTIFLFPHIRICFLFPDHRIRIAFLTCQDFLWFRYDCNPHHNTSFCFYSKSQVSSWLLNTNVCGKTADGRPSVLFSLPPLFLAPVGPYDHIPAGFFCGIQHGIRNLQICIIYIPVLRDNGDSAHTDRNPSEYRGIVRYMQVFDSLPDHFQIFIRRLGVIAYQDRDKLFPAVTSHKVRCAMQEGGCGLCYIGQNLIARRMAEAVVINLKLIYIEDTD